MARKKKFSKGLTLFLALLCLVLGCVVGFAGAAAYNALSFKSDEAPKSIVEGEMQIHFLELGNKYTGDCTYIKAGETDILIDAGSKTSSIATISSYINEYVTDGKLEYVLVTHAHQDHYAGFTQQEGSLFDLYEVGTIIDFARTNQEDNGTSNMYGRYLIERAAEIKAGATHLPANECAGESFDLGSGISMKILDSFYYYNDSSSENDYSVCTLFTYGDYNYLFTGDLEEEGEEHLIAMNDLPEVDVYKAGHHGSKTSSCDVFLEAIKPEIVCVCCCAGSEEYTDKNENQFPTQQFIDRVSLYTDKVYVTTLCVDYEKGLFQSMNGNITVVTDKGGIEVVCSADDRILKEWEWFQQNRGCPSRWQ